MTCRSYGILGRERDVDRVDLICSGDLVFCDDPQ